MLATLFDRCNAYPVNAGVSESGLRVLTYGPHGSLKTAGTGPYDDGPYDDFGNQG
jgi:hypothetical protein